MTEQVRVAIVGGGVTGLCTAFYLSKALGSDAVVLLEASDNLGGQTQTSAIDGYSCDWGPNGFLDREPATLQWIADLGGSAGLVRSNAAAAHRFILKNGALVEVPLSPPAFLKSPLLSVKGRARLLCEPLIRKRTDPSPESLWAFAARRIGREAADYMVDPMASGIFGGNSKELSLAHCFPRMAEMESEHGSLFKAMLAKKKQKKKVNTTGPAGTLTSFKNGIGHLPELAAAALGDRARCNTRITELRRDLLSFRLRTESGDEICAESVVLALPAFAAAEVARSLDEQLATVLSDIPYANMVVLCTGFKRERVGHDLNGFGFVVPRNQGKRMLGCIWTSSVFDDRAPEGHVQLRTMYGGYTDSEAIDLSDQELIELQQKEVGPLLGFDTEPDFVQIYRWPRGIPQYTLEHGDRMARIEAAEARHPGLIISGNAYRGVGLNDCVLSAHRAITALRPRTDVSSSLP